MNQTRLNQSLSYKNLVTNNHNVMDDKLDPMKYNIST
jgi:formylmethanofuran dehydrogenase subunit E-like metal-binding protein